MLVINKEAIVLDRIAKGSNFVRNFRLMRKCCVQSHISIEISFVKELDRSWIAVVVNPSPVSLNCLHALENLSLKIDLLRSNYEICSVES